MELNQTINYSDLNPEGLVTYQPAGRQFTMQEVLAAYQHEFLDKIFLFSIFGAVAALILYFNIDKLTEGYSPLTRRVIKFFATLNLIPALYYPILMIGIYTGWYQ